MNPCRNAILVMIGCLSVSAIGAMGQSEILRYPVSQAADGSLAVVSFNGKSDRLVLPPDVRDGYRFSWQGSYYELVTYASGRFAVISPDPYLKGKSLGHSLYLNRSSNPSAPIPEWVTDDRVLLTGLPQYSGRLALRYSKESQASTKQLSVDAILRDSIQSFVLSGVANPSDADKAAAAALAADLSSALAPRSEFSTYWIKFSKTDPSARPKDMDFISVRKVYGLVVVPEAYFSKALQDLRAAMEAGRAPAYSSPNAYRLFEVLASALPGTREGTGLERPTPSPVSTAETLEVLRDIPAARASRPDAVAVVIGNRSYKAAGVPAADSAAGDSEIVRAYLTTALGFPPENVVLLSDATLADFNGTFGTASVSEGRLFRRVKPGLSDVFVFYSGRGALSRDGTTAYLLPVDCDPALVQLGGYSLETLFGNLAKLRYRTLTLVLETSFAAEVSREGLPATGAGPASRPDLEAIAGVLPRENVAVFLAAEIGQTSYRYAEKGLSLFTYCFAKGIQEMSVVRPASISAGALSTYIRERVEALAKGFFGREQAPAFYGDPGLVLVEPR